MTVTDIRASIAKALPRADAAEFLHATHPLQRIVRDLRVIADILDVSGLGHIAATTRVNADHVAEAVKRGSEG
jgi:hypothetical protein